MGSEAYAFHKKVAKTVSDKDYRAPLGLPNCNHLSRIKIYGRESTTLVIHLLTVKPVVNFFAWSYINWQVKGDEPWVLEL